MKLILIAIFFMSLSNQEHRQILSGRVLDSAGQPVINAWVKVVASGISTHTDQEGYFAVQIASTPVELEIVHPGFESHLAEIPGITGETLQISLKPRRSLQENVLVTTASPHEGFAPVGATATLVELEELPTAPTTLTEMVESVPGVAENGQGGIFQVYSIRGVSRQRVLTTISGIRLTSERRAGVSASFLDPLLMDSVDVMRGPSSSYYGSGALGGVVQIVPRHFETPFLEVGYETQGDENYQLTGWGDENWSLGLVRRAAGNSQDATGIFRNSHFTQYSAVFSGQWNSRSNLFSLTVVPSLTRDIGKASTDYPEQITEYPEERHLAVRFSFTGQDRWRIEAYVHPHDLHTRDIEGQRIADVFNDTFDYGSKVTRRFDWGNRSGSVGIEYFGRRSVDALERQRPRFNGSFGTVTQARTLQDGQEDELGVFAAMTFPLRDLTLEAGGRFSYFRQKHSDFDSIDDSAINGFLGIALPVGGGFELSGSLGSGLRFPSLSERFFSGTTGRGEIIGNPNLKSERSFNFEGGLRWFGSRVYAASYAFRNSIDNYVERLEVQPDVLTFVNLTDGTIQGVEFEAVFQPQEKFRIRWEGSLMRGEDNLGNSLADIPVARTSLGGSFTHQRFKFGGQIQFRADKDRPGSSEKQIPAAQLLSAFVDYRLLEGVTFSLAASNLTNEVYFNSADRQVPLATSRSFQFSLRWWPEK